MEKTTKPQASLIISVYDNVQFLEVVLHSVARQSWNNFEIIISEDGTHPEMVDFLTGYPFIHSWKHIQQEDTGWRKNKALNKAIINASADYLVFIDGDCLLHPRFMEMHIKYARPDRVLGGKRLKMDVGMTRAILEKTVDIRQLNRFILKRIFRFKKMDIRFPEEALFVSPNGLAGFIPSLRKIKELRGCNMSFHKENILKINGFDEDYKLPAIGEDVDITWRFLKLGLKLYSVRNLAVVYHLYHTENWSEQFENLQLLKGKTDLGQYRCVNGISKNTAEYQTSND